MSFYSYKIVEVANSSPVEKKQLWSPRNFSKNITAPEVWFSMHHPIIKKTEKMVLVVRVSCPISTRVMNCTTIRRFRSAHTTGYTGKKFFT